MNILNGTFKKISSLRYYRMILIAGLWIVAPAWMQPLPIIRTTHAYWRSVRRDTCKRMIDIRGLIPGLKLDLKYATPANFTGRKLYPETNITFLRQPAAEGLKKAQKELATRGLGLKIWDAYRPYHATVRMWDLIQDERYVANPLKGSGHNRGLAVDLTLFRISNGNELEMGTGFDHFSDTAHHSFTGLPSVVLENRKLLRTTMEKYGFRALETEWWHYAWPNDRDYELLDLRFMQLKGIRTASPLR